ncbi:hypothetical protein MLD38_037925 [Melastoma candidum]|uniref:Uncharacterized protein n=1 Tax=Melastoma candidum TaxID=119954 RepID=A0ACB9KXG9_9MYRT|nr:hypothetical protein MLD38_037925 [Melastoma candidum]
MAEPPCKRPRDDIVDYGPNLKKQLPPYDDMILSLLDDDEDVPGEQDELSSFMNSLQRELEDSSALSGSPPSSSFHKEEYVTNESDQEDRERVMRRLLEASDDELGLPSRDEGQGGFGWGEDGFGDGDERSFCDGGWEIEQEEVEVYEGLVQSEELLL